MMRLTLVILVVVAVALLGSVAFLVTWDIPAPSSTVEKIVPDDRFPR
jgi:hypothetical protein